MEKLFNPCTEYYNRRKQSGIGSIVIISFVFLFLSFPHGIKPQQVHPAGIGVCTQVVRRIESHTVSYIQSTLVSFRGVCSWLDIQGCDQYKIVFTPAYKKAFRTVYQQVYTCCRGYKQVNRRCVLESPEVPIEPSTPTKRPTNVPRPRPPTKRPTNVPRPRPPKPRPPRPNPRPSNPDPNPGGGWGDLPIYNSDGHSSNGRPGDSDKPANTTPTPQPDGESNGTKEPQSEHSENATNTLRLLMVIGILLSVIGISVACSLCMMCWNHNKRDNRRRAKSYAYVSKGKDDSTVTISTISRGYSVDSFGSVSSASEASACDEMTGESSYRGIELDEGDSGIGKGSFCGDESTSLVSDGTGSLEKNHKLPKGHSRRPGLAQRLTNCAVSSYSYAHLESKSKKQDREHLSKSTKETWTDLKTISPIKEKNSVYHTLEPELFEEDDSCDDGSCYSAQSSEKPKAYAYAKVNLDQNTGIFYGTDPRYGVFPLHPWEHHGSTGYGSLASSTMTLHNNNGYDRLDRNCRQHHQGETSSSKPCRHRDIEQQLIKLKPPPPPVSPKPNKPASKPAYHDVCPDRRTPPPPPERHSLGIQSERISYGKIARSVSNASISSDATLTPPPSPRCLLLKPKQDCKRLMSGSLGDVSVRSEGCQRYSNTKPTYSRFVGGSWNNISTIDKSKTHNNPVIKTIPAYTTISREQVRELSNKFNVGITPSIRVQDSDLTNSEAPYTVVMRMSSMSDVSIVSDGKLTPPCNSIMSTPCGSMSDISVTSGDRYMNTFSRNTCDFSDIDLNTPRNTKDFSDIELVNLSSESLKMDTRYSFASSVSSTFTYS